MNIAILGCDFWSPSSTQLIGDVSEQFNKFFGLTKYPFTSKIFNIHKKEFPQNIDEFDLFIVTGSKFSVYENEDWMPFLFEQIRFLDKKKKNLFGVCFGHQAIAHALGGKVEKVRWNFGHGILNVKPQFSEQFKLQKQLSFLSIHQDQVVQLPSECEVWCENEICPIQGIKKGKHILTIQAHPELSSDILMKAIELKEEELPENIIQDGLANFYKPLDDVVFSSWLYCYFEQKN